MGMTGDKKSSWESFKINETWNDSKKFWVMIKELLGKKRELNDEAFIYEEGMKKEIMTCEDTFTGKWTENIYQKLRKADFSFWYGSEDLKGTRDQMIEELENGNPDIMENPIIEEKEFKDLINDMKNGRASGVDNIPAEAMKVLIKDKDILKYLLKCFNRALVEKVHEDWLLTKTTMIPKKDKPGILDHRPIAVTVNSSKIVCTILRKKIEEFLKIVHTILLLLTVTAIGLWSSIPGFSFFGIMVVLDNNQSSCTFSIRALLKHFNRYFIISLSFIKTFIASAGMSSTPEALLFFISFITSLNSFSYYR